jgi:endoglucanase
MPFAKLPYRGLSLSGAEWSTDTSGAFASNNANAGYGAVPGDYFYPEDWPDLTHYPGGYGKVAFPYYRSKGMNTFRLAFRWERLQRTLNSAFNAVELADLEKNVTDMEAVGAFVLLDPHNYARYASASEIMAASPGDVIGSAKVPDSAFADFWNRLATLYKNDPNVLFGLMNEPYGVDGSWPKSAQAAVTAIRAAGATNLILIGGNAYEDAATWPQASDALKSITDPGNNFAFEVHVYPDATQSGTGNTCPNVMSGVTQLQPFTAWAKGHNAKGFLGEFSAGTDTNANANCMTAVDNMLTYLEQNSDVYVGWTYWAGGAGWGSSNSMEYCVVNMKNSPQMTMLAPHLK